ncbi:MAG: hypothetical protein H6509_15770 [Bryobacterales bacterium]|nr:hypothetical protein [Bryobacterales bacterium]
MIQELRSEDEWFRFEVKGKRFIKAYEALSPEPVVLSYTEDLKWVGGFLPYGRLHFEEKGDPSFADHSADIREMLEEHLSVTGIKTVCKLRRLTDPDFFADSRRPARATSRS